MDHKASEQAKRIALEIAIGVLLTLSVWYAIDYVITSYLPQYVTYKALISEFASAAIVLIIGLFLTNSLLKYVELRFSTTRREFYGLSLLIRVIVYAVILAIVLSIFKISITGILAGSAIGGIVLGLAVQTIASNLISSLFVTSSRTLKYGDVVTINSWVWSPSTTGKIIEVKTLFSKILTKDNNIVSIPNSVLLGSSVIIEYKDSKGMYTYPFDVTLPADVPIDMVINSASKAEGMKDMRLFSGSKNGVTNTIHALLTFNEVTEINAKQDIANMAIDKAYWKAKNSTVILGPSYTASSSKQYSLLMSFPIDVSSEKLIKAARSKGIKLYLVSKPNNMYNTFLAELKPGADMAKTISTANVTVEKEYLKLRPGAK